MVQKVLPKSLSDHNAVLLADDEVYWGPKPFKFFNHWTEVKGFKEMLLEAWDNIQTKVPNVDNIWYKLKEIKMSIKSWHQLVSIRDFGNISHLEEEIESLEKRLQDKVQDDNIRKLVMDKKVALWSLYRSEEQAWQ